MNYCSIDDKAHILKLIDLLFNECIRASGDGDAEWYSRYYNVTDILPLVEEYNRALKFPWTVQLDKEKKLIQWFDGQSGIVIHNNEDIYKSSPDWIQMKIKY